MGWIGLNLVGYAALLLWGTHMVTSGVMRGFGAVLRQRLARSVGTPWRAFAAGLGLTVALQSSTATGLMAASFTAEGLVGLQAGYIVMLGANVGTALVARVLSFPVASLAPMAILLGVVLFRRSRTDRSRNVGRIAIGLGLMLLSLHLLVDFLQPLSGDPALLAVETWLFQRPWLTLLAAAGLAWLCHSSMAVILLAAAITPALSLPPETAVALMLGANVGAAGPPVLEVSGVAARRLPLGNLLVRGLGCVLVLGSAPVWVPALPGQWTHDPGFVVSAHVAFNVMLAALAAPWAGWAARALGRLLPDPPPVADPGIPRHLDSDLLQQPHLALVQAEREVLRLVDTTDSVLTQALGVLRSGDERAHQALAQTERGGLRLGLAIRRYLASLSPESMPGEEVARQHAIQYFVTDLEGALDVLVHHVAAQGVHSRKARVSFSDEEWRILEALGGEVRSAFRLSVAVLVADDRAAARTLVASKPEWRAREESMVLSRQSALRASDPLAAIPGDPFFRAFSDLKRVHSLFLAIAYRVLEASGELRSRLISGEDTRVSAVTAAP